MAAQFEKYQPLRLVRWMVQQEDRSPAIAHYLSLLAGSLTRAFGNTFAKWLSAGANMDAQKKEQSIHVGLRLADAQVIAEELLVNDPLVIEIIKFALKVNPWPRGVRKYMDKYIRDLDAGSSSDSSSD